MKGQMQCPVMNPESKIIRLAHGGGGRMTHQLISEMFFPAFANPMLDGHDGAVFDCGGQSLAYTTDSFVVNPLFFRGGSIGDLAVNGTVNDLACCGAQAKFLSCAFIIEEGLEMSTLERIVQDMHRAAQKAGVWIVTGDTKVVERGHCDGIFINTSGIGVVKPGVRLHPDQVRAGDAIIVSGNLGEHGICILSERAGIELQTQISSDTAPLCDMVGGLLDRVELHLVRDATRGGISSTLNEIAQSCNLMMEIDEALLPVSDAVKAACALLGLDVLCVANEGVMLLFVPQKDVEPALQLLHSSCGGRNARCIGMVRQEKRPVVVMRNAMGVMRPVDMFSGEQLPRIC